MVWVVTRLTLGTYTPCVNTTTPVFSNEMFWPLHRITASQAPLGAVHCLHLLAAPIAWQPCTPADVMQAAAKVAEPAAVAAERQQ